jgi:hypothetical protein
MLFRLMLIVLLFTPSLVLAQDPPDDGNIFGISVDPAGAVKHRRIAPIRRPAPGATSIAWVSLPKLFTEAQELAAAGKPLPADIRYPGGITQLRYVVALPEQNELLIGGPAEPLDVSNPLLPLGKITGRPALHLDDLLVALRMVRGQRAPRSFGCSIDPPDRFLQRGQEIFRDYANRPRSELLAAMSREIGPQKIRILGELAPDSRMALSCVAADYHLKRMTLGLEPPPIPGIGNTIDNTRPAGNAFWFETLYEPLLVSPDGNLFEIRGQRLELKCGAIPFDDRGATEKAKAFAKQFTQKVPQLAAAVPLFADLQNVSDIGLLAYLIREDRLDRRVKWDFSSALESDGLGVQKLNVPQSTETLVNIVSGSVAAGGVGLNPARFIGKSSREIDEKGRLKEVLSQVRSGR